MKNLILLMSIAAISATAAYSGSQASDAPRQIKAGDTVRLGEGINIRVVKNPTLSFTGVKLTGSPVVVLIEFDGGRGATVSYKATPNAKSDIYLVSGEQKIAPVAVIENFPSWGSDNDKEIEVLNSKDSVGSTMLNFAQKGSVAVLFDLTAEQAKAPQKLSLLVETVRPNKEKYSFVVTL